MPGCPVCNGLLAMTVPCPNCQVALQDHGMATQYDDDYSPYRGLNDLRLTNGYPDLQLNHCLHLATCPHCDSELTVAVEEIALP